MRKKSPLLPISAEQLYSTCDPEDFSFETTEELDVLSEIIGQERAVKAVNFAMNMEYTGYNLFAVGPIGVGKHSLIMRYLQNKASQEEVPPDWCYVYNFSDSYHPKALSLPAGLGARLRQDMSFLIKELQSVIPALFESEEFRSQHASIERIFQQRQEHALSALQKKAQKDDVMLVRTSTGFAFAPMKKEDHTPIAPEEFEKFSDDEKTLFHEKVSVYEQELKSIFDHIPAWDRERREKHHHLEQDATGRVINSVLGDISKKWLHHENILNYLEDVRADILNNISDFLPPDPSAEAQKPVLPVEHSVEIPPLRRYQVNLFVDNSCYFKEGESADDSDVCGEDHALGAPVIFEDFPSLSNLVGRIEHLSFYGSLITDFTLIKPGAFHKANGGYLVIDARKLLLQPWSWENLKRVLDSDRIRIEAPSEIMGLSNTVTLDPESIPAHFKVILLGDRMTYRALSLYDPDFREHFKVVADFDSHMRRDKRNSNLYARFLATVTQQEGLLPLNRGAVARVVEYGSRLADDSEKLTAHMRNLADLIREASFLAKEKGHDCVVADDIQRAISTKIYRFDRIRELIQEEIRRDVLVIETEGDRVGQINGLSVLQTDQFAFGQPNRISCTIRPGKGSIIDIEREVKLGGALHSKGVLILSSFLASRYAADFPLALSASLTFEQSYGYVDGDSASSAELYALLSALSSTPINQSFAVTGSVDQHGRVQAIGGVNEKIEGFFDVCKSRTLDGKHAVLIPKANCHHLMLRHDVVEAVWEGKFSVWAVSTIDEGIELLTGVEAGEVDKDGNYPSGTINALVKEKLYCMAKGVRDFVDFHKTSGEQATALSEEEEEKHLPKCLYGQKEN